MVAGALAVSTVSMMESTARPTAATSTASVTGAVTCVGGGPSVQCEQPGCGVAWPPPHYRLAGKRAGDADLGGDKFPARW